MMRKVDKRLKEVVNKALRFGRAVSTRAKRLPPFVVQARPLGLPLGLSYDNIAELIDQLEGPLCK
jgi:hypothetical protein